MSSSVGDDEKRPTSEVVTVNSVTHAPPAAAAAAAAHAIADDTKYHYERTLMVGRYSRKLSEFAAKEAQQQQQQRPFHNKESRRWKKLATLITQALHRAANNNSKWLLTARNVMSRILLLLGEEYLFLFVLGFSMAVLSYTMDIITLSLQELRVSALDCKCIVVYILLRNRFHDIMHGNRQGFIAFSQCTAFSWNMVHTHTIYVTFSWRKRIECFTCAPARSVRRAS